MSSSSPSPGGLYAPPARRRRQPLGGSALGSSSLCDCRAPPEYLELDDAIEQTSRRRHGSRVLRPGIIILESRVVRDLVSKDHASPAPGRSHIERPKPPERSEVGSYSGTVRQVQSNVCGKPIDKQVEATVLPSTSTPSSRRQRYRVNEFTFAGVEEGRDGTGGGWGGRGRETGELTPRPGGAAASPCARHLTGGTTWISATTRSPRAVVASSAPGRATVPIWSAP